MGDLARCERCGARLEVVTVSRPAPGIVRRSKRCSRRCGFRLVTVERPAPRPECDLAPAATADTGATRHRSPCP
jgi:hypothetical protein